MTSSLAPLTSDAEKLIQSAAEQWSSGGVGVCAAVVAGTMVTMGWYGSVGIYMKNGDLS